MKPMHARTIPLCAVAVLSILAATIQTASAHVTTHASAESLSTTSATDTDITWTAAVPSGAARSIQVRWVDRDGIVWVGLDDIERTLTFNDTAFVIADDAINTSGQPRWPEPNAYAALTDAGAVLVDLVDGQRLIGLLTSAETPDAIGLRLGVVCELTLPLERIRRIVTRPTMGTLSSVDPSDSSGPSSSTAPAVDDSVMLVNGDRASGFLVALDPDNGVTLETAAGLQRLSLDRVAAIHMANPAQPVRGLWVDLKDGRTIAASAILPGRRELRSIVIDPIDNNGNPAGLLPLTLREIASIVPARARMVPLAMLPEADVVLPPTRRWSPGLIRAEPSRWPARLAPIELPGPMQISFTLPEGASAFSAIIRPGVPASAWASATVRVGFRVDDLSITWATELAIDGDSEPTPVRLDIPDGSTHIVVLVDASERGSVDDRIRLERGAIHIDRD